MNPISSKFAFIHSLQFVTAIVYLFVFGTFSPLLGQNGQDADTDYTANAYFVTDAEQEIDADWQTGKLFVDLSCAEDWVGYATTTPTGGPLPTKIRVTTSDSFEITGDFNPLNDPHRKFDTAFGVEVNYHPGGETWVAPLRLAKDADLDSLEIRLSIKGQVCSTDEADARCTEVNEKLVAQFDGELESPQLETKFAPDGTHTICSGLVSPANAQPGEKVSVAITLKPTNGYKVYAFSAGASETTGLPTRIAMQFSNGWASSPISPDAEPEQKMFMGEQQSFHTDTVTWTFDLTVPEAAKPGKHTFTGLIGFQNCNEETCDVPACVSFEFDVAIGETTEGESKIGFGSGGSYRAVAALADRKAKEAKLAK